jgi:ligand-binding SRPBCC domain-containing protein
VLSFEYSSEIDAPIETVFGFHERPDALQLLTPPWQRADLISREGGLEVGARVVMRVWFGPVYKTWVAHHIAYQKNRIFTDEQREGPFAAWVHSHVFEDLQGRTRLIDSIEFALPFGSWTESLLGGLATKQLKRLFAYRHMVTKTFCEQAKAEQD